jgi:iron complex transport system substrate-binding protein
VNELDAERLSAIVVDAAFQIHRDLGPGLLESVYETVLAHSLEERGLDVDRQKMVPFTYRGMRFNDGLRVDLMINKKLLVELKSVEQLSSLHTKQLLTYLRLLDMRIGLLINFSSSLFRDGCIRLVNGPQRFEKSRLRLNQKDGQQNARAGS